MIHLNTTNSLHPPPISPPCLSLSSSSHRFSSSHPPPSHLLSLLPSTHLPSLPRSPSTAGTWEQDYIFVCNAPHFPWGTLWVVQCEIWQRNGNCDKGQCVCNQMNFDIELIQLSLLWCKQLCVLLRQQICIPVQLAIAHESKILIPTHPLPSLSTVIWYIYSIAHAALWFMCLIACACAHA